jgi:hypothetical protein
MRRFLLAFRQWRFDRHWRKHSVLRYDCAQLGLTPRPPDDHSRGEYAANLQARYEALLDSVAIRALADERGDWMDKAAEASAAVFAEFERRFGSPSSRL